jgi:phenylalanyl-tRNA synthetase beta chain
MPKSLHAGDVVKEIKKSAGPRLQSVAIFDQYAGEKLPAGQKSVAFRLTLQGFDGTLQDEEVQTIVTDVLNALAQKWGLTTR